MQGLPLEPYQIGVYREFLDGGRVTLFPIFGCYVDFQSVT